MLFFNLLAVVCVFALFLIPAMDSVKSNLRAAAAPRLTFTESALPIRNFWDEEFQLERKIYRTMERIRLIEEERQKAAALWKGSQFNFEAYPASEECEDEPSTFEDESPIGGIFDFTPAEVEVEVAIQNDLGLIRGKQEPWVCWGRKVENISTINVVKKSANNNKGYKKPPKLFERWPQQAIV